MEGKKREIRRTRSRSKGKRRHRNRRKTRSGKRKPTLKVKGCRTLPWTVVDSRMTAVSGQYWYQLTLMF